MFGFWWSGRGYLPFARALSKFIPNSTVEEQESGSVALWAPLPEEDTTYTITYERLGAELNLHPLSDFFHQNLFPCFFNCTVTQTDKEIIISVKGAPAEERGKMVILTDEVRGEEE